ncbi:hypothetical protein BHE74_00048403 [Ensete ventricosum]|nr:hypothetical protein BHE74_00048403 [Ensete ventricosum]
MSSRHSMCFPRLLSISLLPLPFGFINSSFLYSTFGSLISSQESVDAVREPTWVVYPENSSNSDHVSAKFSNGVDVSTTTEMPLGQSDQHKSRVLSEDSDGTNLQTKTVIQQVTKSESKDDGFQKPEMGQENKATAFKKSTFATESVEQVKRDANYGCSSEAYL